MEVMNKYWQPIVRPSGEQLKSAQFDMRNSIRYVGRIDWSDDGGPILSWPGSSIAARFKGSSITMYMTVKHRDHSWVNVSIDGGEPYKLYIDAGVSVYTLATDLRDDVHTIEVYKRTEGMFGSIQFMGFTLSEGGTFLEPPARLTRKVEIIGDSISCGSGNEGREEDLTKPENENNELAYGTIATHALDAEHHTIAVSGIGLVVNYDNDRDNTMPVQYKRLNPIIPESRWDFSSWIPDLVVINLGTNDNNFAIDQQEFVTTYCRFVTRIRSNYPQAKIVMTLGPFQQWPLKDYVVEACEQLRAAGDLNIYSLIFDLIDTQRDGLGEEGHPTTNTHVKMADQLTQEIKRIMAW